MDPLNGEIKAQGLKVQTYHWASCQNLQTNDHIPLIPNLKKVDLKVNMERNLPSISENYQTWASSMRDRLHKLGLWPLPARSLSDPQNKRDSSRLDSQARALLMDNLPRAFSNEFGARLISSREVWEAAQHHFDPTLDMKPVLAADKDDESPERDLARFWGDKWDGQSPVNKYVESKIRLGSKLQLPGDDVMRAILSNLPTVTPWKDIKALFSTTNGGYGKMNLTPDASIESLKLALMSAQTAATAFASQARQPTIQQQSHPLHPYSSHLRASFNPGQPSAPISHPYYYPVRVPVGIPNPQPRYAPYPLPMPPRMYAHSQPSLTPYRRPTAPSMQARKGNSDPGHRPHVSSHLSRRSLQVNRDQPVSSVPQRELARHRQGSCPAPRGGRPLLTDFGRLDLAQVERQRGTQPQVDEAAMDISKVQESQKTDQIRTSVIDGGPKDEPMDELPEIVAPPPQAAKPCDRCRIKGLDCEMVGGRRPCEACKECSFQCTFGKTHTRLIKEGVALRKSPCTHCIKKRRTCTPNKSNSKIEPCESCITDGHPQECSFIFPTSKNPSPRVTLTPQTENSDG